MQEPFSFQNEHFSNPPLWALKLFTILIIGMSKSISTFDFGKKKLILHEKKNRFEWQYTYICIRIKILIYLKLSI
jgi:hypothetical protein